MGPLAVPENAPPMFVAIAADDFLLEREKGTPLVDDYRRAGKSIAFHLFASGKHGFGLGRPHTEPAAWPDLMLSWLRSRGILKEGQ
jgi:acetyl esterase/lipase